MLTWSTSREGLVSLGSQPNTLPGEVFLPCSEAFACFDAALRLERSHRTLAKHGQRGTCEGSTGRERLTLDSAGRMLYTCWQQPLISAHFSMRLAPEQ